MVEAFFTSMALNTAFFLDQAVHCFDKLRGLLHLVNYDRPCSFQRMHRLPKPLGTRGIISENIRKEKIHIQGLGESIPDKSGFPCPPRPEQKKLCFSTFRNLLIVSIISPYLEFISQNIIN